MHPSLFDPEPDAGPKPPGDQWVHMHVLITVKAAPTPSDSHGETVCVAGLRLDLGHQGWVRLYPINFRAMDGQDRFRKYEVVRLRAKPARQDRRRESWKPDLTSVCRQTHVTSWKKRRLHVDQHMRHSMCGLQRDVRNDPPARSLAVVRVRRVLGFHIERHPGWTDEQLRKIERTSSAPDLFGREVTPLEAPRFHGKYRYLCMDPECNGHRQGLLDWEFAALQHRFADLDDAELQQIVRRKFVDEKFRPNRDIAFYVGNQAKRGHVFSVLGVYNPDR